MNKFINILLLLILFPVIAYAIIIGFDFPLDFIKLSGANIPYKIQTFSAFGLVIFLIGARRSIRRWLGVKMVGQLKRFQWNAPMGKSRYRQSMLYLSLEALLHLFVAFALFQITDFSLPVVLVLLILALDHLVFGFVSKSKQLFRIGVTSKAILVADRDLKAIYFKGLRRVSQQQQSLFFDYIKDLQISIPLDSVPENERENFKTALAKNLDRETVFFSEGFKNF